MKSNYEQLLILEKAVDELGINFQELKPKYKSLEGTRHIIQFEGKDYTFTLSKTFKPKIECYGVTNRCQDGKFILFLDYDKIYKDLMFKNLDNLLEQFPTEIGNFYIAQTGTEERLEDGKIKGSYHVINFAKNYKTTVNKMVELCDVDLHFKAIPQQTAHKTHVLRVSEKFYKINGKELKERPTFLQVYPKAKIDTKHIFSKPHFKFLKEHWGINEFFLEKFDDSKECEIHKYLTPEKESDAK